MQTKNKHLAAKKVHQKKKIVKSDNKLDRKCTPCLLNLHCEQVINTSSLIHRQDTNLTSSTISVVTLDYLFIRTQLLQISLCREKHRTIHHSLNPLSVNRTEWSNTLKQSSANCRRIV